MITMPCDYAGFATAGCENGKVLIYGEMGRPPEIVTCPKCKGTGLMQVEESWLLEKIADLMQDRNEIDKEISELEAYLPFDLEI